MGGYPFHDALVLDDYSDVIGLGDVILSGSSVIEGSIMSVIGQPIYLSELLHTHRTQSNVHFVSPWISIFCSSDQPHDIVS